LRIGDGRLDVTGAAVEARALILAALQETTKRRIAIVVPGDAAIDDFEASLRLFHSESRCVSAYPSPSLSPYQDLSPSLGVVRNEIRALGMLIDRSVERCFRGCRGRGSLRRASQAAVLFYFSD
jgi:transcription-repair coupling factor (superfamily II helicase)